MTLLPRTSTVASFDGTRLSVQRFGSGQGAPTLLVNAIGPDVSSWRLLIEALQPQRRLITWDFRGFHGSEQPRSDRFDAAAHCEDAVAVMDDSDAATFFVVAWSTGTRIAIEIARRYPERVKGLALVSGGFGRGFRGLFRYLEMSSVLPFGAGLAKHFAPSLEAPFRAFVRRPEIAGVVRQSGVIGPTADVEAVVAILRSFADCDLRTLLSTYEEVVGDPDPDVLTEVRSPTLLVSGGRDRFATPGMVEEMAARIPDREKVLYEKGSHFLPVEYPQRLALDLDRFLTS